MQRNDDFMLVGLGEFHDKYMIYAHLIFNSRYRKVNEFSRKISIT